MNVIQALFLIPVCAGVGALIIRSDAVRRCLLVLTATVHFGLTLLCWLQKPEPALKGWLQLDQLGLLFLTITSLLFLAAAVYAVSYLNREQHGKQVDFEEGILFLNAPEAVFTGCMLFFLATMTLAAISQHLGLFWVAIEATTLASAPLIYFHRHHRSLEATWKYLMICSVGIALALLGIFFLAVAGSEPGDKHIPLVLGDLIKQAPLLHIPWLKAAFLFLLVGYGTKMGLAPMHTWLPDAHSESPSVVSALLSGAVLNCAFLGILRIQEVCVAAGLAAFGQKLLLGFGLVSMTVAALFILGQTDYKRMLAYSSVENMGVMAVGIGLGAAGNFGALLHAVNHSLTKGMLFLVAGNIVAAYKTKSSTAVQGMLRVIPLSGILWVAGFLAIVGSPPFGPFLSEFTILKAAIDQGRFGVGAFYLAMLAVVFIGMASAVLRMAQGKPSVEQSTFPKKEKWLTILPPATLGIAVLVLGVYIPPFLSNLIHEAAQMLGGS